MSHVRTRQPLGPAAEPAVATPAQRPSAEPSQSNAVAQDLLRQASFGPVSPGILGGGDLLAQAVSPAGSQGGALVSPGVGGSSRAGGVDPFAHLPPSQFGVAPIDPANLAVTAFPVGQAGARRVLHVYEQTRPVDQGGRPVFAKSGDQPTQVDPLLANFDFAANKDGARYTDSNGYSVRVGDKDLPYRMVVERSGQEWVLVARPNRDGGGPEMVIGRSGGDAAGPLELQMEPGWQPMRRQFQGKNLGHVTFQRGEAP
jgi:hypothetical protein